MELTLFDENVWKEAIRDFSRFCKISSWKTEYVEVVRYSVFTGSYSELLRLIDLCESEAANRLRKALEILIMAIEEDVIDELEGKDDYEVMDILIERLGLDTLKPSFDDVEDMVEFQMNRLFVFAPIMEAIRRLIGKENKMKLFLENVYVDVSLLLVDLFSTDKVIEGVEELLDKVLDVEHVWLYPAYKISFDLWNVSGEIEETLDKYADSILEDVEDVKSVLAAKNGIVSKIVDVMEEEGDEEGGMGEEHLVRKVLESLKETTFAREGKIVRVMAKKEVIEDCMDKLSGRLLQKEKGRVKKL